jgi:hypothetical protein
VKSDGKRTSQRAESLHIEGSLALGGFDTAVSTFFCPETKEGKSSPFMVGYFAIGSVASDRATGALSFAQHGGGENLFATFTDFGFLPRRARLRSRNFKGACMSLMWYLIEI